MERLHLRFTWKTLTQFCVFNRRIQLKNTVTFYRVKLRIDQIDRRQ